jgi:serralysin
MCWICGRYTDNSGSDAGSPVFSAEAVSAPVTETSGEFPGPAAFVTSTVRWDASTNGSGSVAYTIGGNGGVVTWSIAGAGLTNQSFDPTWFTGSTVTFESILRFDYVAELRAAFAMWSAVANIEFVQIADGGGNFGVGENAAIRIGAAYMDGAFNTLAAAYFPFASAEAGDIIFDSGETTFWTATSFRLVALHEIGHSLGLDHEATALAVMNAFYNPGLTALQTDDINGIRAMYGAQDGAVSPLYMRSDTANLTLVDGIAGLRVVGNTLANTIQGTALGESMEGGGGGDTILGLDGADSLNGGTGADSLDGGAGDDRFIAATDDGDDRYDGGADNDTFVCAVSDGNDTFTGGAGFDILDFSGVGGVVQVNQLAGTVTGSAGNDTLSDVIEQIIGTAFGDVLSGGHGINILDGNGGDDQFYGNGGDDLLRGGAGNDRFYATTGDGADRFMGGDDNDTFFAALSDGDDSFNGGNGFDVLDFSGVDGVVQVNQLAGTVTGSAGNDTLVDVIEQIIGTAYGDVLSGGHGINALIGGGGNDTIYGNNGDDYVNAGTGSDTIYLGVGNDAFNIRNGDGSEALMDFTAGGTEDFVDLRNYSGLGITNFTQLEASGRLQNIGGHAHLVLDGGDIIHFHSVADINLLTAADFLFT